MTAAELRKRIQFPRAGPQADTDPRDTACGRPTDRSVLQTRTMSHAWNAEESTLKVATVLMGVRTWEYDRSHGACQVPPLDIAGSSRSSPERPDRAARGGRLSSRPPPHFQENVRHSTLYGGRVEPRPGCLCAGAEARRPFSRVGSPGKPGAGLCVAGLQFLGPGLSA